MAHVIFRVQFTTKHVLRRKGNSRKQHCISICKALLIYYRQYVITCHQPSSMWLTCVVFSTSCRCWAKDDPQFRVRDRFTSTKRVTRDALQRVTATTTRAAMTNCTNVTTAQNRTADAFYTHVHREWLVSFPKAVESYHVCFEQVI